MERIDLWKASESTYKRMIALDESVTLEPPLRHLVKLRASQINGCAYCIEMHSREAAEEGEAQHRLHGLGAWREVDWYSERERAALALTEAMTRLAEGPVSDEVFDAAAAQFDQKELAQLMWAVTTINAWNRIAVTSQTPPDGPR